MSRNIVTATSTALALTRLF